MTTPAEEYVVKTTLFHRREDFGTAQRALANLNRIAEACIIKKAQEPIAAIGANDISLLADVDRPHVLRLLKNRPGFTKVIRLGGRVRSVGWYYHPEYYDEARRQGSGFYPFDTNNLATQAWPYEQVISSTDVVEETRITGDNIKLPEIKYSGSLPLKAPVLVDTIDLTDNQVGKIFTERARLLSGIGAMAGKYAEAVRQGKTYDDTHLREQLTFLISLVQWIKEAQGRPEYQLLLHDIIAGARDEEQA